jgi:hypothetical protein
LYIYVSAQLFIPDLNFTGKNAVTEVAASAVESSDNEDVQFLEVRPLVRNNGIPIPTISCDSSDDEIESHGENFLLA